VEGMREVTVVKEQVAIHCNFFSRVDVVNPSNIYLLIFLNIKQGTWIAADRSCFGAICFIPVSHIAAVEELPILALIVGFSKLNINDVLINVISWTSFKIS
jgi:hypothetical protein